MNQTYGPADRATSRTPLVLLALWAAMTLAALAFVLMLGSNAPYADEWEFVPALTRHEPVVPWLWKQHNEHRMVLPRIVYYTLFQIAHDFRAGMVVQVALLSGLSFWLMRVASRLRGRPHWADAFFPVSLLHVGHWENLLMGYQLCFVLFAVFTTALGVVALRTTPESAFRSGMIGGVLSLLLALCGGFGLPVALTGAAWVLVLAVGLWRTAPKWQAVVLVALTLLPVAYTALYFQGYQRPPGHPEPAVGPEAAVVAAETLSMAFGIGVAGIWWAAFAGMLVLGAFTLNMVVRKLKPHAERPAATGVLAVAAGVVGLAFAIGIGRAGFGTGMGLWSRYSLLTWPLLGLAFLAWTKHGGRGGKWIPAVLCAAAALTFPTNMGTGMLNGANVRNVFNDIEAMARLRASPQEIAARFKGTPHEGQEGRAIVAIPMLREAGIGAFRK